MRPRCPVAAAVGAEACDAVNKIMAVDGSIFTVMENGMARALANGISSLAISRLLMSIAFDISDSCHCTLVALYHMVCRYGDCS